VQRACCWHLAAWFGVVKISAALPARGHVRRLRNGVVSFGMCGYAWIRHRFSGNKVGDVRRDPLPKVGSSGQGLLVAESAGEEEGCECGKGCRLV